VSTFNFEAWADEKGLFHNERAVADEFRPLIEWALEEVILHVDDEPDGDCYGCRGLRILCDLGVEP